MQHKSNKGNKAKHPQWSQHNKYYLTLYTLTAILSITAFLLTHWATPPQSNLPNTLGGKGNSQVAGLLLNK